MPAYPKDAVTRPAHVVIGPEEGRSLWQPLPSRGYVQVNLTPSNMPFDHFSSGIQVLPPGCSVRGHGHERNHELIFIYEGTGFCTIDEQRYDLVPGTTVLFCRYCVHYLENTGDSDMKLFWVFMPPGLENWFEAIGRERTPGEPMPDAFPRPDDVEAHMAAQRFVPPKD